MKNKIIKLVGFLSVVSIMMFLPALISLGFDLYLNITMKSTGKLPTVNTFAKLEELVGKQSRSTNYYYDDLSWEPRLEISSFSPQFDAVVGAPLGGNLNYFAESTVKESVQSSNSYSTTNTQVIGVDEADILKNDGKYIYALVKNKLVIVDAYPAEQMKKIAEVEIVKDYIAKDLYILGDKLFLVTENNNYTYYSSGNNSRDRLETKIILFDITNRAEPKVLKTFEFTGKYTSSRLIEDTVYVFSNMKVKYRGDITVPEYRENEVSSFREVSLKEVQYVPNDTYNSYTQIIAFDINNPSNSPKIVTYLGSSAETVYMSHNNLFMAQNRYDKTEIYKFKLTDTYPRFEAKGSVDGTIINQFAMDEYDGAFRIATTKNRNSAVYILSESMHILGSVRNIAPSEEIKSVRFEGDRGYVVTFRNTDPLFVLDLSNKRAPKILGELKITGYSTYLHPYDENHVIGFGYDGTQSGTNGRLKLALFDITDVENPREMYKEVIDANDSELLDNHKALLFDKEKELIAFSVGKYAWREDNKKIGKVYSINLENGFSLRGEIKHDLDVKRMLYIGDVLYGVSDSNVSAHDIKTVNELNKVSL